MTNYKFNANDKAIKLELVYFDNPYHFESCVSQYTVKGANQMYFTIANENDYNQKTGKCTWQSGMLYHKEKDKELILDKIEKASRKFDLDREKENNKRIEYLQSEIEKCQSEINEIKSGNGKMKIGFTLYDTKEYKEKVLKKIFEKLNYPN